MTANQVTGERASRKLKTFVKRFWEVLEPTNRFQDSWHIDAICDHLEHVFDIKRLLINIPPRHTKSLLCSVFFPAWLWLQDPSVQFLCCSYALSLSKDLSLKTRRLIESPLYQHFYRDRYQLVADQNTQLKFANSKTGYRQATSIESGNIGQGGDVIVFDDPNDISTIASKAERDHVITFWREVLSTRTNYQPNKTARIIIQQRCHQEDLSGYILENDCGEWCRLVLPFEFDRERTVVSCLGWRDPRVKDGQPLSQRIPTDERELFKREKGNSAWQAQYNQNPRPDDGKYFRKEHFRYFTEDPTHYHLDGRSFKKSDCHRFVSTDLAISLKTSADFSAFAVVDITPENDIVVALIKRDRLDASRLVSTFKGLHEAFKPAFFLVEQVGFQDFAIQQIRHEGVPVRPVRPTTDKLTRSVPLQIRSEAGQLWFLKDASWLDQLEGELLTFPSGKHDDQVDTLAWAAQEAARRFRKPKIEVQLSPEQLEEEETKRYREALVEGLFKS